MNDVFAKGLDNGFPVRPDVAPKSARGRWIAAGVACAVLLLALAGWYLAGQYNAMLRNDERVEATWSQLLSQYKRRADLIPNLVSVVKSYAAHESAVFKDVASARARLSSATPAAGTAQDMRSLDQFQQAQNQLAASLARLLVVADKYPELKSNGLYRDLMVQLEGTENRIAYSRLNYIEAIAEYNFTIRRFPGNLVANYAQFKPRPRFSIDNEPAIAGLPKIDLK